MDMSHFSLSPQFSRSTQSLPSAPHLRGGRVQEQAVEMRTRDPTPYEPLGAAHNLSEPGSSACAVCRSVRAPAKFHLPPMTVAGVTSPTPSAPVLHPPKVGVFIPAEPHS